MAKIFCCVPADVTHEGEVLRRHDEKFYGEEALGDVRVQSWRRPFRWLRVGELHRDVVLFGTISSANIKQGELGDCWLLAAIAVLADFPGHIQNLFNESELSPDGLYHIHLFHIRDGWTRVEVDDQIPCDKTGKPLFAQLNTDLGEGDKAVAIWPLLLEKAIAKFVGKYSGLDGGSAFWAWQVLMAAPEQVRWTRDAETCQWSRGALVQQDVKTDEQKCLEWRMAGMRKSLWRTPMETCDDEKMFTNLAIYSQANYPMTCAVSSGGTEHERPDGLLCKHEYTVLQIVEAYGVRLVNVRNPWGKGGEWRGAWADGTPAWDAHPRIRKDLLRNTGHSDDGVFWMPWDAFADVFGGDITVSPVTLPIPRNSQVPKGVSSSGPACPRCRLAHARTWLLTERDEKEGLAYVWHRLEEKDPCFLCLRATARASKPILRVAGVHSMCTLGLSPPPAPTVNKVCEYGAKCFRRNPQHFDEFFHPHLLPRRPVCSQGCGHTAASGFKTCCSACQKKPPDVQVQIPLEYGLQVCVGDYKAVEGLALGQKPVYKNQARDVWLWYAKTWMFGMQEGDVGGNKGILGSQGPAEAPQLVDVWVYPKGGEWAEGPEIRVSLKLGGASIDHDSHCKKRAQAEEALIHQADALTQDMQKFR